MMINGDKERERGDQKSGLVSRAPSKSNPFGTERFKKLLSVACCNQRTVTLTISGVDSAPLVADTVPSPRARWVARRTSKGVGRRLSFNVNFTGCPLGILFPPFEFSSNIMVFCSFLSI